MVLKSEVESNGFGLESCSFALSLSALYFLHCQLTRVTMTNKGVSDFKELHTLTGSETFNPIFFNGIGYVSF